MSKPNNKTLVANYDVKTVYNQLNRILGLGF